MLLSALRDLQWRRRRVLIAILGTALVFALTLMLAGVSHGFDFETDRTMGKFRTDGWVTLNGAAGPFIGQLPMLASTLDAVRKDPGVTGSNPLIFSRRTVGVGTKSLTELNLFGVASSGVGVPPVDHGRAPNTSGEIVVSTTLHDHIGKAISVSGRPFRVVGTISNWTAVAGVANGFVTIADAQKLAFLGQPIISAVAVTGTPRALPPGTRFIRNAEARNDLLRPVGNARDGINLVGRLLWFVAATIIGSVIYLSALERVHDFAIFKATGTSSRNILADLVVQAILLSLVSAGVGVLAAKLIGPLFPVQVVIPQSALVLLPVLAVTVGLLASLLGLRRAVAVDPAVAFSSA
jgi:putative ABC transport system permease protein